MIENSLLMNFNKLIGQISLFKRGCIFFLPFEKVLRETTISLKGAKVNLKAG